MTYPTDAYLVALHGRIVALELLMTACIVDQCARAPQDIRKPRADLLANVDALRQVTLSSVQNAQRHIGEAEDVVWNEAAAALDQAFRNARARLGAVPDA